MAISNINSLSLDPSGGFPASATANVQTQQTTTSTSFTDLATAGPAVTVTTGTKALISISAFMTVTGSVDYVMMSFAVSGATTLAASGTRAAQSYGFASSSPRVQITLAYIVEGLTAGANTFTAKYASHAGQAVRFENRYISVIDMGS